MHNKVKRMILNKLITVLLSLFLTGTLYAQEQQVFYPKIKILVGAGLSFNSFYGKQPFSTFLCTDGCLPVTQKTLPNFTFGGQVTVKLKQRHYVGIGYRLHQLKLKQEIYDFFDKNTYPNNLDLTYHSFSLIHQYQLNQAKKYIWWNNAIGLDKTKGNNFIKSWAFFYRTSLSFQVKYYKNRGLAMQPFLQIGISPYTQKSGNNEGVMRPIMLGLTIDIPYDVYK